MMNKTQSLKNFVYLVGMRIHNTNVNMSVVRFNLHSTFINITIYVQENKSVPVILSSDNM